MPSRAASASTASTASVASTIAGNLQAPVISEREKDDLRQLEQDLRDEVVQQYERFVEVENRHVDFTRWELARTKDGLRVYRSKRGSQAFPQLGSHHGSSEHSNSFDRSGNGTTNSNLDCRSQSRSSVSSSSSSDLGNGSNSNSSSTLRHRLNTMEIGPQAAMAANSSASMYMIHGTVQGNLDDMMYGLTVHDTRSLQRRSAQLHDGLENSAVLTTLASATTEDPFRFLGVLWYYKYFPLLTAVVKPRDTVVLISVGMYETTHGERIGMMMNHSIDLSVLHSSSKKRKRPVRSLISVGKLFRQAGDNVIEVFMTDYADPKGHMISSLFTDEIAAIMLTDARGGDCGFNKKLEWLLAHAIPRRSRVVARARDWDKCALCSKSLNKAFARPGRTCALCHQVVCSDCSVRKRLFTTPATSDAVVVQQVHLCVTCILRAQQVNTFEVAQKEVLERRTWDAVASRYKPMGSSCCD